MNNPNPDEMQFLTLAAKELSGKITPDESSRLAKYVRENQTCQTTFNHMQALQRTERDDRFLESAVRVICGTATPKEIAEVQALKKANPKLWRKFQFMRAVVTGIAKAAKVDDTVQFEPMPERVRQILAAKVKEIRAGPGNP